MFGAFGYYLFSNFRLTIREEKKNFIHTFTGANRVSDYNATVMDFVKLDVSTCSSSSFFIWPKSIRIRVRNKLNRNKRKRFSISENFLSTEWMRYQENCVDESKFENHVPTYNSWCLRDSKHPIHCAIQISVNTWEYFSRKKFLIFFFGFVCKWLWL